MVRASDRTHGVCAVGCSWVAHPPAGLVVVRRWRGRADSESDAHSRPRALELDKGRGGVDGGDVRGEPRAVLTSLPQCPPVGVNSVAERGAVAASVSGGWSRTGAGGLSRSRSLRPGPASSPARGAGRNANVRSPHLSRPCRSAEVADVVVVRLCGGTWVCVCGRELRRLLRLLHFCALDLRRFAARDPRSHQGIAPSRHWLATAGHHFAEGVCHCLTAEVAAQLLRSHRRVACVSAPGVAP